MGAVEVRKAFFDKIGYKPHKQQWLFHNSTARFRIPVCGRRFGKDLSLDTPILTVKGWSTMAALKVGEWVFDATGKPTQIVAKSEVMHNVCYRIVFNDGSEFIAGAGHEWPVETYTMRRSRGNGRWDVKPYKVMTTEELAKRVGKTKYPDSVMLGLPVQLPEQKLPIDPYVYGVWLGDGTTGQAQLTCHEDDYPTYLAEFEKVGYGLRDIPSKRQGWKIVGLTKSDCLSKVVSDAYRMGSVDQRLALLQGLMDTDGTVSNEQLQFDNKNKALCALVEWLVVSLGGKTKMYLNQKDEGTYWRVGFNVSFPCFRLQRKLDKQMRLKQGVQQTKRYVQKVERVETVPTQCIQVDAQSHLYLAGHSLVPTHNSTMAGRDLEPYLFQEGKRYWIIGPTYDLAEKEFRVVWDDLIVKRGLGREKKIKRAYNKRSGDMYIEFPWRTRLEVRSADHPELLVGEALDGAIMSEAAKQKKETWERFIRPSLADKRGWATFPTTPEGFNWLHDIWRLGRDPSFPSYESWKFPSWANTAIYPGGREDPEIVELERTTVKEWFEQEIGADFSSFVGKILVNWDEFLHVQPHEFNPNWPNYMAFDWGFTNPLAAIEFQVAPDDTVYIWREHYKSYMTLADHVRYLKSRENPPGYRLDMAFGDAADPEAAMYVSQNLVGCIADPAAKKKEMWGVGINIMNNAMKSNWDIMENGIVVVDEYGTPQYRPGYFVDPKCVNTIKEHNNYRSKEPIKGKNVPELGQQIQDHTIDALRYALVQLFHLGVNHHLDEVYGSGETPEIRRRTIQGEVIPDRKELLAGAVTTAAADPEFRAWHPGSEGSIFSAGKEF